ncbi:hypothetical protein ACH41E_34715 [Streptomyces sp. NPDC020412]|uniref:hypothetical protein n=1 Tax=Streptomyces sp. NPDC020412 TaxID=3365073 RepID=UPI00379902A6
MLTEYGTRGEISCQLGRVTTVGDREPGFLGEVEGGEELAVERASVFQRLGPDLAAPAGPVGQQGRADPDDGTEECGEKRQPVQAMILRTPRLLEGI